MRLVQGVGAPAELEGSRTGGGASRSRRFSRAGSPAGARFARKRRLEAVPAGRITRLEADPEAGKPREASSSGWGALSTIVTVPTEPGVRFHDITDLVSGWVRETRLVDGLVNLQSLHTTAGVAVNENEPLLLADMERMLESVAPRGRDYEHDDFTRRAGPLPDDEPVNGHAHCKALLVPSTLAVNVTGGRVVLGRWQRIFLVELDGPRSRDLSMMGLGTREPVTPARRGSRL
jgi:secondary thiamine-phosphate synthase enzyme